MKRTILFSVMLVGLAVISCRKKDIQPVISLNGQYQQTISLGSSYVESGATAKDNKDGDITDDIVITGSVNTGQAGEYRLFYDVEDSEGNKAATAVRFVEVVNDANFMIGTYSAVPSCTGSGTILPYKTSITVSDKTNNQIYIRKVLFLVDDEPVVGNISGTDIDIPLQTIGSHTVEGSATLIGDNFSMNIVIDAGITFDCTITHVKL